MIADENPVPSTPMDDATAVTEVLQLRRDAQGHFLPGNPPGPGRRKQPKPDPTELVIDLSALDRKPSTYANDVAWVSQNLGKVAGKLRPPSQRAWTMFQSFNETDRARRAFFERHAQFLLKATSDVAANGLSTEPEEDPVMKRLQEIVAAYEQPASGGESEAQSWP